LSLLPFLGLARPTTGGQRALRTLPEDHNKHSSKWYNFWGEPPLELPRVPGMEILRRIRADARLAGTKVIIATAYPDLAAGLEEKADLVLFKPVSFIQLRDLATRLGLA
jgi:hypothetical protein